MCTEHNELLMKDGKTTHDDTFTFMAYKICPPPIAFKEGNELIFRPHEEQTKRKERKKEK